MKKTVCTLFIIMSMLSYSQKKLEIYFDFDKFNLNQEAIKKINSWIAEGKNYEVLKLYGFCDSKGTNAYNDTLALKRVHQVYNFLKESNIEVKKDIEIRGFGEDFEQSKVQGENRRVTLIFQEKEPIVFEKRPIEILKERITTSKKGDLIKLPNFYFFNNSAKIVPKSLPILYELLCIMSENPNLKIEIQGHICCKSPQQYEAVSTARARTVYNYLILNKINRNRMTFKGYGVSRPVHPIPEKNTLEEEENRRVEILIIEN